MSSNYFAFIATKQLIIAIRSLKTTCGKLHVDLQSTSRLWKLSVYRDFASLAADLMPATAEISYYVKTYLTDLWQL